MSDNLHDHDHVSGRHRTILRPSWFNQNFDEGFFRDAVLAGTVAVPVGDVRQAFVDARDIAAMAAVALTQDGHAGETYEVTGPQALSFAEAPDVIGRAAGRHVRFDGTVAGYRAARTALGQSPEETAREIAAFTALAEVGDAIPSDVVHRVTGRRPTAFDGYAAEAAANGAWRH